MRVTFDISACNYYQKEGMQSLDCLVTQRRLNKSLSFLDQGKNSEISDIYLSVGKK